MHRNDAHRTTPSLGRRLGQMAAAVVSVVVIFLAVLVVDAALTAKRFGITASDFDDDQFGASDLLALSDAISVQDGSGDDECRTLYRVEDGKVLAHWCPDRGRATARAEGQVVPLQHANLEP